MKNNFEREQEKAPAQKSGYDPRVEAIALKAAEMEEFRSSVERAQSGIDAVREVRVLLRKYFPEIEELPEPKLAGSGASNEAKIAKHIVELLRKRS